MDVNEWLGQSCAEYPLDENARKSIKMPLVSIFETPTMHGILMWPRPDSLAGAAASTLQQTQNARGIERLLAMCPTLDTQCQDTLRGLGLEFPLTSLGRGRFSTRAHNALLAVCNALNGTDSLISENFFHSLLSYFLSCLAQVRGDLRLKHVDMRRFGKDFTQKLLLLTSKENEQRQLLLQSTFKGINVGVPKGSSGIENSSVLFTLGMLQGMLETDCIMSKTDMIEWKRIIFKMDQCQQQDVYRGCKGSAETSFDCLILSSLAALLRFAGGIFYKDELKRLYKRTTHLLSSSPRRSFASLCREKNKEMQHMFGFSIQVGIRCGELLDQDMQAMSKWLLAIVKYSTELDSSGSAENKNGQQSVHICKGALEGLDLLVQTNTALKEEITHSLFYIILSKKSNNITVMSTLVDSISLTLAAIIADVDQEDECGNSSGLSRRYILKLEEILQRYSSEGKVKAEHLEKRVLKQLGMILSHSRDESVVEQILPIFFQKFQKDPHLLHLIIGDLIEVALRSESKTFSLIISLLTETYRKPFTHVNRYSIIEIRNAFSVLAQRVDHERLQLILLRRLIELIHGLGHLVQYELAQSSSRQFSSVIGTLGFLFPAVACLLRRISSTETKLNQFSQDDVAFSKVFSSVKANMRHFRSLWFLLTLFKFVHGSEALLPEWLDAVREIASFSPPLNVKGEVAYLGMDTEANPILDGGPGGAKAGEAYFHKELARFTSTAADRDLSLSQIFYLSCVYHLEKQRAETSSFFTIFCYLEDSFLLREGISKHLCAISDAVFNTYMDQLNRDFDHRIDRYVSCVESAIFLCLKCASFMESARAQAHRFLQRLIQRFPFLVSNGEMLCSLVQITSLLEQCTPTDDAIAQEKDSEFKMVLKLPTETLCSSLKYTLKTSTIVKSKKEIVAVLYSVLEYCCVEAEPLQCEKMLSHLTKAHSSHPIAKMPEYLQMLQSKSSSSVVLQLPRISGTHESYLGEIRGLYRAQNRPPCVFATACSRNIIASLEQAKQKREFTSSTYSEVCHHVFQLAALVLWNREVLATNEKNILDEDALIRIIAFTPSYFQSPVVLHSALSSLDWLQSQHSYLLDLVHIHARSSWYSRVNTAFGMFCPAERDADARRSVLFSTTPLKDNKDTQYDSLWISFLTSSIHLAKERPTSALISLCESMFFACCRPWILDTTAAYYNILLSMICPSLDAFKMHVSIECANAMIEQLLLTTLKLFESVLEWRGVQKHGLDLTVRLLDFLKMLHEHASAEKQNKHSTDNGSVYSLASSNHTFPLGRTLSPKGYHSSSNFKSRGSIVVGRANLETTGSVRASIGSAKALHHTPSDVLVCILSHEAQRQAAWSSSDTKLTKSMKDAAMYAESFKAVSPSSWRSLFCICWNISPSLAYGFARRFQFAFDFERLLINRMQSEPIALIHQPQILDVILKDESHTLPQIDFSYLCYFDACSLPCCIKLMLPSYAEDEFISEFVRLSLSQHDSNAVIFYMNEIIQALQYDKTGALRRFLQEASATSPYLAHQIIWCCQAEGYTSEESSLSKLARSLEQELTSEFRDDEKAFFEEEFSFFDEITNISLKLQSIPKPQKQKRNDKLRHYLSRVKIDSDRIYIPTHHESRIHSIICDSATTLQSAAKVPFLAQFNISSIHSPSLLLRQAVIFKAGDDVRRDALTLKLIRLMKDILQEASLGLFLLPYKVIPMRSGPNKDIGGIIECIPNAKSRDELGKSNNRSLRQEFVARFGHSEGFKFATAQRHFVQSMAGYAIATYILQIKDRHNGNIMIDDVGHILHIDFGFIFDISPGGDLGVEGEGFKFTKEMMEVMDGLNSETYNWFVHLCIKGYLAIRSHAEDLISIVLLMKESGLGCFKAYAIENLKTRLSVGKSEMDAAKHILYVIQRSYNNRGAWVYDQFQWRKEGVWYGGMEAE